MKKEMQITGKQIIIYPVIGLLGDSVIIESLINDGNII